MTRPVLFCPGCNARPWEVHAEGCRWFKAEVTEPPVADRHPLRLTVIPEGIRVVCGDLDRVYTMSPKAMRAFAIRMLAVAEE